MHTVCAQEVRYVGESVDVARGKQRGKVVDGYILVMPRDYVHRSKPNRIMGYKIQLQGPFPKQGVVLFCPWVTKCDREGEGVIDQIFKLDHW